MAQSVKFGGCRFDLATGQLWSGEEEVRLTPKASAVLKVLVTHAGQPVSKEHLFETVWSDAVVGDDALASCIQELRRALADDAKQPRFIETRHRRGYRFAAAIDSVAATDAADKRHAVAPEISAIAVLPFADMSPGRTRTICEGQLRIINALTHVQAFGPRPDGFLFSSDRALTFERPAYSWRRHAA